jgi:NADH-quinone oxidoreductase subunit I
MLKQFLKTIFMVELFKGLYITLKHFFSPVITEQYPKERTKIAERYRGLPKLHNDPETGETFCIACNLCALACPLDLITVGRDKDPVTKKWILTTYEFDLSRCMFCGLCEEACPTPALELTQDYEMAYYSREGMVLNRQQLELGVQPPAVYTK